MGAEGAVPGCAPPTEGTGHAGVWFVTVGEGRHATMQESVMHYYRVLRGVQVAGHRHHLPNAACGRKVGCHSHARAPCSTLPWPHPHTPRCLHGEEGCGMPLQGVAQGVGRGAWPVPAGCITWCTPLPTTCVAPCGHAPLPGRMAAGCCAGRLFCVGEGGGGHGECPQGVQRAADRGVQAAATDCSTWGGHVPRA